MKLRTLAVVCSLFWVSSAADAQTIISTTTYGAGLAPVVVSSSPTITTNSNSVIVSPGATVTFQSATSVKLEPGFHASTGGNFYAMIGSLADSDGDGLPDVWERAHGLNPNNPADASAVNPLSGLTYLVEYQLGTTTSNGKQADTGNSTQLKINRPTQ